MDRKESNRALSEMVAPARKELEAIRRRSGKRRVEIPEHLLEIAVNAARIYGVAAVSSRLGISYYRLKKLVTEPGSTEPGKEEGRKRTKGEIAPGFVELMPLFKGDNATSVLEFENPNGVKLRLKIGSDLPPGLVGLVERLGECLWRASK